MNIHISFTPEGTAQCPWTEVLPLGVVEGLGVAVEGGDSIVTFFGSNPLVALSSPYNRARQVSELG